MKFGIKSSAEVAFYIERAKELRKEYIARQIRQGFAALSRLIHGSRHAAVSGIIGASGSRQRDASMVMRTTHS